MKVALVTGAARRIGAALIKKLHEMHYNVVLHYHQSEVEAKTLAQKLEKKRANSVLLIQKNLSSIYDARELISQAARWQNRLDLLINNASIFTRSNLMPFDGIKNKGLEKQLEEQMELDWQALFDINLKIPFFLSLAAYPYLAKEDGNIINLTDIHAEKPLKHYAVYCQTKAALLMQTKVLAREFAPHVRVNAVAPGAIDWPENENKLSDELKQAIIEKTPLKRHGDPEYIAQAVLALVENSFITGQVLRVDGGRSLIL